MKKLFLNFLREQSNSFETMNTRGMTKNNYFSRTIYDLASCILLIKLEDKSEYLGIKIIFQIGKFELSSLKFSIVANTLK